MATLYHQTENDQRAALVIETYVAQAEKAWNHDRSDFHCDDAEDLGGIWITLGQTRCGVWIGDSEESAILIDTPITDGQRMAQAFGLTIPAELLSALNSDLIHYQPTTREAETLGVA